VESEHPRVVCVASIPPLAAPRVRYLLKRIRARVPDAKILAAIWDPAADRAGMTADSTGAGADQVALTLREAIEGIRRLHADALTHPPEPLATSAPLIGGGREVDACGLGSRGS
jgi:hypothetical protein